MFVRWSFAFCWLALVPLSASAQLEEVNDEIVIELGQGKVTARLSPDGQKAVWVNRTGSSSTIFMATPNGSMTRKLLKATGKSITPYWLSDSKRLVYLDGDQGDVQIKLIDQDKRLFAHGPYGIHWAPEGESVGCRISFLGGREGDGKIYGDDEYFVIGRDGKFQAFENRKAAREQFEWIPDKK